MATINKNAFDNPAQIKLFRQKNSMNQTEFWSRIGVTQSGGSRYESGRNIPVPVQRLLLIAYGTEKQAQKVIDDLRGWQDA